MCLYVKQEFKTRKEAREYRNQPQIADKNIRVYKVLQVYRSKTDGISYERHYLAPHRGMIYKRGKQYSVPGFTFNVDHAYTIGKWRIVISRGLHAYVSEYAARKTWSVEIY